MGWWVEGARAQGGLKHRDDRCRAYPREGPELLGDVPASMPERLMGQGEASRADEGGGTKGEKRVEVRGGGRRRRQWEDASAAGSLMLVAHWLPCRWISCCFAIAAAGVSDCRRTPTGINAPVPVPKQSKQSQRVWTPASNLRRPSPLSQRSSKWRRKLQQTDSITESTARRSTNPHPSTRECYVLSHLCCFSPLASLQPPSFLFRILTPGQVAR